MQIAIKGRNVPVTDEIREHAVRRLDKVARQVSELARIEIEIFKEPNPRVSDCHVAEATLYLKGVTLRARDSSPEMLHSLNLMVDELARQVKRPPRQTPPPPRGTRRGGRAADGRGGCTHDEPADCAADDGPAGDLAVELPLSRRLARRRRPCLPACPDG